MAQHFSWLFVFRRLSWPETSPVSALMRATRLATVPPSTAGHHAWPRTASPPATCKLAHLHNLYNAQRLDSTEETVLTRAHRGWPRPDAPALSGGAGGPPDPISLGFGRGQPPSEPPPRASRLLLVLVGPRGARPPRRGRRQPLPLCHAKTAAPIQRDPSPRSNPITSAAVASLSPGPSVPLPAAG